MYMRNPWCKGTQKIPAFAESKVPDRNVERGLLIFLPLSYVHVCLFALTCIKISRNYQNIVANAAKRVNY